ncbi:alpha-L-rhamnosidase-related protein [Pararcticibacter amylolyticus]|uniref:Alpha-rhamnosidase n=1 Tax=Pararcticibacter amylolyticus TaxID=2173175 RepID=A0A2U2PHG7_9SPHI|nr:family 78 glycoside hydrolase catalytic domain [Pararcticibacter amylolyticus]PWG80702.1 alpha-rhamnosidase [Pararcticibacter amylolyticus]
MKKIFILLTMLSLGAELTAQSRATWIWYPGDFEVWLSNRMQNRRTERGSFFPPFWRMDSHFVLVDFHKVFEVPAEEQVELHVEGQYNVKIDGKGISGYPRTITMPAGKHKLSLKVFCQDRVPAIFVKGKSVVSDSSWLVTYEDKEWIDASGKASDQSGTTWLSAGSWNFDSSSTPPSKFTLATTPQQAVKTEKTADGLLVDFGKETFGYVKLEGLKGQGRVSVYYGESKEEALATETCETLDHLDINLPAKKYTLTSLTKAFRFVNIKFDSGISLDKVSMLYEYLPVADRGDFRCSDAEINKIYDISKYTFHLNTREFFIDGIKRDRWIWSGDAYQSFLMNYYLLFDSPSVTRTLLALRGKDPVSSHMNTIMDYTFYWFLGISDYYLYTGDKKFIEQFYPRMQSLMEFCLARRNASGLMEGLPGDWVFIDWADGLSKQGAVSFEQLLLARSLETMATCAGIVNDKDGVTKYGKLAEDLKSRLFSVYWNEQKQALVHSLVDGKQTDNVTRYANMFGIFFDYFSEQQKQGVKKNVLLNDKIQKITTPYMRFYELEALCAMGEQKHVTSEMKDYWGGMLKLGATSFWEEYDPSKKGAEHYSMYGRPFGKSLCHAWGASPLYLLGKYYLGVKPLSPGYATYVVEPALGGLKWMDGKVPAPSGDIKVYCSTTEIRVQGIAGRGVLRIKSKTKPSGDRLDVKSLGSQIYEIGIAPHSTVKVKYSAL